MSDIPRYTMGLEIRDNLRTHQDDWTNNSGPAAFIVGVKSDKGVYVSYIDHAKVVREILSVITQERDLKVWTSTIEKYRHYLEGNP